MVSEKLKSSTEHIFNSLCTDSLSLEVDMGWQS
jgi:hypothetical protein